MTFVNNFSAASGNTTRLMEDFEATQCDVHDSQGVHMVTVLVKSQSVFLGTTSTIS